MHRPKGFEEFHLVNRGEGVADETACTGAGKHAHTWRV